MIARSRRLAASFGFGQRDAPASNLLATSTPVSHAHSPDR